tara:strand:+ start:5165 stop:5437 length:273 start_codon:yes stop_codon:yes gene_type:complete
MTRTVGSKNTTNYHYIFRKYSDETKTTLEDERYFRTQGEIQTFFKISRCSIYCLLNSESEKKISRKFKNLIIEKLKEPIPVFRKVEIDYL